MPIYEYICQDCSSRVELIVRASTVLACPRCQSRNLEKQLSVFAVATREPSRLRETDPCGTCRHAAGPGACSLD